MKNNEKHVTNLRAFWEKEYESDKTPFDVNEPDLWVVELEKSGKLRGKIFDAGCGTGRTAIYLARLGYDIVGVDISNNAIERAKLKTAGMNKPPNFIQSDLCCLSGYDNSFDTVIDIGCFHSLFENELRYSYAATLYRICRPNAILYLRAISNANKKGIHTSGFNLPSISEEEIRDSFSSNGWKIKELEHQGVELLGDGGQTKKSYCWFAEIERNNM
ncbi:MAG: methyltransferase domain-containing protein [Planctomycetaceae bacterium]|jgi:SAM-dependent methyltransferase|nr:methyltransferase domain-containing protein [Planctomycetaceae bacterium]